MNCLKRKFQKADIRLRIEIWIFFVLIGECKDESSAELLLSYFFFHKNQPLTEFNGLNSMGLSLFSVSSSKQLFSLEISGHTAIW